MIDERKRVSVTPGMANAAKRAARTCSGCDLKIPVYPGAYPKSCPNCGMDMTPPSVTEQIELVKAGIPAEDVIRMTQPDLDPEQLDEVLDRIKSHFKSKLGDIKKHLGTAKKAGTSKKTRKVKKLGQKEKKLKKKAKKGDKKAGQKAAKLQKKRKKLAQKVKQAKGGKKKTKKESVMEHTTRRTLLTNQEEGIRTSIHRMIAESGSADLSKVAQDFKANPVAVYNLAIQRQDEWGLVVGGNGYKAFPRKSGERIQDNRR